jgi:hypothetical protein
MAKYDSPGYQDMLPGFSPRDGHTSYMSAPGSEGSNPGDTTGPVIATPLVTTPGVSTQIPAGQVGVPVTSGDTSGQSNDDAIPNRLLAPAPGADRTGAGSGHYGRQPHPNAAR